MCGIAGIVSRDAPIDPDVLQAMGHSLAHRGPDDSGLYTAPDGRAGLAHRRLSIIDLSLAGKQPMPNEDGRLWLTFNGEIYNFAALRAELETLLHRFRSRTDSEVILHGYETWGDRCVERLRGMFAFGLWDAVRGRLLLARDRLGIKPLYYAWDGERLRFASELKALLADPGLSHRLDPAALADYLTYLCIPAPRTIYTGIQKLPPGHLLIWEGAEPRVQAYWDVEFAARIVDPAQAREAVREKLREAVALHCVSDVPIGVFLSGGVDSSSVLAGLPVPAGSPARSFSVDFDVPEHSEIAYARLAASAFGTDHREMRIGGEAVADMVARTVGMYDEPFADGSAIPTYLVSALAAREVKVVLSGDGGDEVFGGYVWYRRWQRLRRWDAVPRAIRSGAGWTARLLLPAGVSLQKRAALLAAEPLEQYGRLVELFSPEEKRQLLGPAVRGLLDGYDDYWALRRYWREDLDGITRLQYLDLKTYLPEDILTKVDRASMAVSLEVRVPLLDHELVELVAQVAPAVRLLDGELKGLLKGAMRGLVPDAILDRAKKGFSAPLKRWLAEGRPAAIQDLRSGEAVGRRLLDPEALRRPRALHLSGLRLWALLVLEEWIRRAELVG